MEKIVFAFILLSCSLFNSCQKNQSNPISKHNYFHPAEFELHESIWLAWPTYEYMKGRSAKTVVAQIVESLTDYVIVDLMVLNDSAKTDAISFFEKNDVSHNHIRFHKIKYGDIWIRDMGPNFLLNENGDLKIVDFGFNTWGYETPTDTYPMIEEQVDRLIAQKLEIPIIRSSIISEGGNHEFNGNGTMMVTEAVELQRNPLFTKMEIENEFKRVYNVKKVIWLPEGVADDELTFKGRLPGDVFTVITTGGHIDEYARFVDSTTILLAEVTREEKDSDSIAAMSYKNLEKAYSILKNETDQDGNLFKIIRVPYTEGIYEIMNENDAVYQFLEDLEYEDGTIIGDGSSIKTIIAASYLNYIISNGVVIIPSYWKKGRPHIMRIKDEKFKSVMKEVYPDRDIIQINPENINIGGGGMHCISQQMPRFVN